MSHIRKDAPQGFMYRRKGTTDDFASTVFIGNGRTVEDYELVTEAEYEEFFRKIEEM